MKVKIGNKIYDSRKEPIRLFLSELEKEHISEMPKGAEIYDRYPKGYIPEHINTWMKIEK